MNNLLTNYTEECETSTEEKFDLDGHSCLSHLYLIRLYGVEKFNELMSDWDTGDFADELFDPLWTEDSSEMLVFQR